MTQLSDSKREAILEAATRRFFALGYSSVSMDAIAEAAPVSKPTLYNYFENKPALFEAVITGQCGKLLHALDTVEASVKDFRRGLILIARACIDLVYATDSLSLFRLIIAEKSAFPDLGARAYRVGAEPIIARIAKYLSAAAPAIYHFDQVSEAARLLLSMLMGDQHLQCLFGIKAGLTSREKERLVARVIPLYLKAYRVGK